MNPLFLLATLLVPATVLSQETEPVGLRPYELVWANRQQDDHPPLIDFEDLTGWRLECRNTTASWQRTRAQQIWGQYTAKLSYRATGPDPEIRILPPQPIPIPGSFDAVTLWVYGNNWGWAPDPKTPQVQLAVLFADAQGREFPVPLYHVDWTEWYLLHRRLSPEQIERARQGATFRGLLITGGRNTEDRLLCFDNLGVFTESFPPLTFEPRPARGVPMFPGQTVGNNTGPGQLPFPTRSQTILPDNLTRDCQTSVNVEESAFVFTYKGADGTLTYRFEPKTGTWSDLSAQWAEPGQAGPGGPRGYLIQPCAGGGIYLQTAQGVQSPDRAEHLGSKLRDDAVTSRWRLHAGGASAEVTFVYRLWNKSLVMDVLAPGGGVGEVRFGRAVGLRQPRLVTNPFYPAEGGRPAVAVSGPPEAPLFLAGHVDWYRSNASVLWANNAVSEEGLVYNGGTRYVAKTDGRRNDCFERFFLTLSPRYEETLPTIANPVSPWKHVTGTRVWRAHGASDRKHDAEFWTECHRWGMTQVVVTDHETGWRDGGESFTFRTRAAPGKGGDAGQFDYARLMQDQLGFVYGPYNNFTDFAPVNEYWSTDMVSRTPDNQLQHAWMRCYAPKPARAVEYCARLAPQIEQKFRFSTAYCDVHTAVAPWHRVDYDSRVPGAGTFAAVFYAFGEIMLLQKQAWDGPVYSEGNYHCFYSGLTDGNYGQDQSYRPAQNPWLVDFDLRKMHDLGCNFGMGNPDMFYSGAQPPRNTPEEKDAWIDRFLAATVAFGHPGFLTYEGGLPNALRSYYMLQQLQSRYCLASAAEIRYVDATGRLLDTSAAVAAGAHQRSQVVTRYSDGTVTAVNGSPTERLKTTAFGRDVDLPPNGYGGWTADGAVEVWSRDPQGHRCDYADTPAYLYLDGRGQFMRFPKAAGAGVGICRRLPDNQYEVLLHASAECGFAVRAKTAVALNKERQVIGPATLRAARGLTYVLPLPDAFSYLLTADLVPAGGNAPPEAALSCERETVFAGERVLVRGRQSHEISIPAEARAGERIWIEQEGAWIDFTVVPFAHAAVWLDKNRLLLRLTSNLSRPEPFHVSVGDRQQTLQLDPGQSKTAAFELGTPSAESDAILNIDVRAGDLMQQLKRRLRTVRGSAEIMPWPEQWTKRMQLRGGQEQSDFAQTGTVVEARRVSSGDVAKEALFMHPPWIGAVGSCSARFGPVSLPAEPPAAFRAVVGKGDGSDLGDGIRYRVMVVDDTGRESPATEASVTRHQWVPIEADLTPWSGRSISLKLITDVGAQDNSNGDWGCWAEMRLESLRPVLHRVLDP